MRIKASNSDYIKTPDFEYAKFITPPSEHQPVYSLVWCDKLTEADIIAKIDSMYSDGIRGIYIIPEPTDFRPETMCTYMEPDYLTEKYHELYRLAANHAISKGMNFWIYDEAGWPSGSANGKVVHNDNTLWQRHIAVRDLELKKGDIYTPDCDAIAAFDGNGMKIKANTTIKSDTRITEYFSVMGEFISMPYPDTLIPKSTEDFIKLTHEEYKTQLGGMIGRDIKIFFTDEPAVHKYPWNDELQGIFADTYGYDFTDYLPAIVSDADMGDSGEKARIDYYELTSSLLCRNYYKQIMEWCHNNGCLSTGHINGEDMTLGGVNYGYANPLRHLRAFDIPGIDVIWRQIYPGVRFAHSPMLPSAQRDPDRDTATNPFFPRYASSAANQIGSYAKMTESFGVYGSGITYDEMRYVINAQAIRGINVFNPMITMHSERDHFRTNERPGYSSLLPGASHKKEFNEYMARISYLCSVGEPNASVALYMPTRDFLAKDNHRYIADVYESIGLSLEGSSVEFDIIDDDAIISADNKGINCGMLNLGLASYKEIYLPPCRHISQKAKKILAAYAKNGGKLYIMNGKADPHIDGAIYIKDIKSVSHPLVHIADNSNKAIVMKRTSENEELYYIFNESTENLSFNISIDNTKPSYIINPTDGNIYNTNACIADGKSKLDIHLFSGEMKVIYFTEDAVAGVGKEFHPDTLIEEINDFQFRKCREFVIGKHYFESHNINCAPYPVKSGNWQMHAGNDFSGDAIYSFDMKKPDTDQILIDLGKVNYSCELYINGINCGTRCMPPYTYVMDTKNLMTDNLVEIKVSNTAANQFVYTEAFDNYSAGELGPYHNIQSEFEHDSLPSGIMSPVRIYSAMSLRNEFETSK